MGIDLWRRCSGQGICQSGDDKSEYQSYPFGWRFTGHENSSDLVEWQRAGPSPFWRAGQSTGFAALVSHGGYLYLTLACGWIIRIVDGSTCLWPALSGFGYSRQQGMDYRRRERLVIPGWRCR